MKTLEEIKKKLEDYECIGMYCNHAETEDPHYTIGITDLTNLLSQTKQELIEEIYNFGKSRYKGEDYYDPRKSMAYLDKLYRELLEDLKK